MGRRVAVSIWLVAVIVGMLIGLVWYALSAPAQADHVTEPTAPIDTVALRVFRYPNAVTTLTPEQCASGVVVAWDQVRIEPDIRATQKPSEHFDAAVEFAEVINPGRRETIRAIWDFGWDHSNVPPHTNTDGLTWESGRGNNYRVELGVTYRVRLTVRGLESGKSFEVLCRFTIG